MESKNNLKNNKFSGQQNGLNQQQARSFTTRVLSMKLKETYNLSTKKWLAK